MNKPSLRKQRRQASLELLVEEAGGVSALALAVGTPKSHISAMRSGTRGMGDELAAKMERKFDKEPGWMDELHDDQADEAEGGKRDVVIADMMRNTATLREVARSLIKARDDLSPEQQAEYLAALASFERESAGKGH